MRLGKAWAACFIGLVGSGYGAMITVPNADFSSSANNGTIQGTLLSGGVNANPLGSGPWSASTTALAGLLAPPSATISSGVASISGLLGLGAVGQSNSARFYQSLSSVFFLPNASYTLSATIDTGAPLNTTILSLNGLGIALTAGGVSTVVASSTGAGGSLSLISGTQYRLQLQYTTGALAPSGVLGIKLYSGENASLPTLDLLGSVGFDDIALDAVVPEPSPTALLPAGAAFLLGMRRSRESKKQVLL